MNFAVIFLMKKIVNDFWSIREPKKKSKIKTINNFTRLFRQKNEMNASKHMKN